MKHRPLVVGEKQPKYVSFSNLSSSVLESQVLPRSLGIKMNRENAQNKRLLTDLINIHLMKQIQK